MTYKGKEPKKVDVTKPKLVPVTGNNKKFLLFVIGLLGRKDYYKEIHSSGSYFEIWTTTFVGNFVAYKLSYIDCSRSGESSTTYGNFWRIDDEYFVVSYGHNAKYETSTNNLPLQLQHTRLFNMLLNDIKDYFYESKTPKPNQTDDQT